MNENLNEKAYWSKIIGEESDKVNFQKDFHEDKEKKKQVEWKIGSEKTEFLSNVCQHDDMLIHMFILTVLKIAVTKYSQSTKFFIGIPQYIKSKDVNSNNPFIVLHNKMNLENSFREELMKTKSQMLEAYVYQFFDMHELYTKNNIHNKVNVYCCMKDMHSASQIDNIFSLKENDLTIVIDKKNNDMTLIFHHFNQSLFHDVHIITNIFKNTLNAILNNSSIKLKEIDIVSNEEKNKLLVDFNNTKVKYFNSKTIQQLFEEQVEKTPDNIAIFYEGEKVKYKELNQKANALARVLVEKGVGPDVIVGVMTKRSIEMVIGMMAILKAGGAYLPIDPKLPQKRIEYMIKNSGVNILLTQNSLLSICDYGCEVIDLNNGEIYQKENSNLNRISNHTNLAYVIYTSGTTGNPKGVAVEHKGIINLTNTFKEVFQIHSNKKILQFASISFDAFAWELSMSLLLGAELLITTEEIIMNPTKLSQYIKDQEVNILTVPPFIAKDLDLDDSKVELIITAGSDAKKNMVGKLSRKSRYINAYGPTESTICATIWKYENEDYNTIPIGKPISNTKVYIVDKYNNLLPIGVAGELCISGDGIARGYLANQELTDQKFVNNPFELGKKMYKTGDLARWLPDGNIEFLGRIDHQVKIRGFRIELPEIENRLLEIEGVKDAIVLDKGDSESKYLCAYYVSEKTYNVNELREEIKKYLPDYMIPAYFIKLSELPLTNNGKIDRMSLPEPNSEINTGAVYEGPRNEIEVVLVKVWEQVLRVNRIGINDNYFNLGGNSLNAIQIASLLQEENITIALSDIFMYQDIKSICNQYVAQLNGNEMSNESDRTDEYISNTEIQKFIELSRKKVNAEFDEFTGEIINRPVINKYKLAEIQKMSRNIGLTKSGTKIEFNFEVDISKLEIAVSSLVNREDMLRAAVVEKQSEMYLYEYDTIENVKLPYVDLSNIEIEEREFVLKEVIKDISIKIHENNNYTKNKIYYGFILVKYASNKFILYMIVNHLIFDGMSSEIVKNLIVKEYMNEGSNRLLSETKATYLDYINQIKKGPQECMEEEIIKGFDLQNFVEASKTYHEKLRKIKHQLVFKQIEFEIPSDILNNQDQIWNFAFEKFVEVYRKNLDIVNLPLSILNMGRRFGEKNYFSVIGEFLDIIPYTCTTGNDNFKNINDMVNLASEKNINFITLLNDKVLKQKFKRVSTMLEQSGMLDFNIPIFNYLGVYNADYKISKFFQTSDDTMNSKENKTQRGANCYINKNKLIMFIDVLEDTQGKEMLENSEFKQLV